MRLPRLWLEQKRPSASPSLGSLPSPAGPHLKCLFVPFFLLQACSRAHRAQPTRRLPRNAVHETQQLPLILDRPPQTSLFPQLQFCSLFYETTACPSTSLFDRAARKTISRETGGREGNKAAFPLFPAIFACSSSLAPRRPHLLFLLLRCRSIPPFILLGLSGLRPARRFPSPPDEPPTRSIAGEGLRKLRRHIASARSATVAGVPERSLASTHRGMPWAIKDVPGRRRAVPSRFLFSRISP